MSSDQLLRAGEFKMLDFKTIQAHLLGYASHFERVSAQFIKATE